MLSGYSSIGFGLMVQVLMVKAEEKLPTVLAIRCATGYSTIGNQSHDCLYRTVKYSLLFLQRPLQKLPVFPGRHFIGSEFQQMRRSPLGIQEKEPMRPQVLHQGHQGNLAGVRFRWNMLSPKKPSPRLLRTGLPAALPRPSIPHCGRSPSREACRMLLQSARLSIVLPAAPSGRRHAPPPEKRYPSGVQRFLFKARLRP